MPYKSLELNVRYPVVSRRSKVDFRLTEKGRKSPLGVHGLISSPRRRETANCGLSTRPFERPLNGKAPKYGGRPSG